MRSNGSTARDICMASEEMLTGVSELDRLSVKIDHASPRGQKVRLSSGTDCTRDC